MWGFRIAGGSGLSRSKSRGSWFRASALEVYISKSRSKMKACERAKKMMEGVVLVVGAVVSSAPTPATGTILHASRRA